MVPKTSASYSITMRVEIQNRIGMLGRVMSAIGKAGGDIGAVDIAGFGRINPDALAVGQFQQQGMALVWLGIDQGAARQVYHADHQLRQLPGARLAFVGGVDGEPRQHRQQHQYVDQLKSAR